MKSLISRRLFALLLALTLLLTMLPSALAEDTACLEGCTADSHAEGCPNTPAPLSDPEPTLTGIAVSAAPTKTGYTVGDSLDITGGQITLTYSDSSTNTIAMTAEMVSGFDSSTEGTKTLTVTYEGLTASFDITVAAAETPATPTLASISVGTAPTKTSYTVGETLDVTGGKLTLTYSDSSTGTMDMTAEMVSGFDSSSEGTKTLTVTHEGLTASFDITVAAAETPVAPTLTGISVGAAPAKVSYQIGEALDVTGGKLTLTYSDSTTGTIDMTAEMVSGFDSSSAGTKTLTVTYQGMTAAYTVTVQAAVNPVTDENGNVRSIEITYGGRTITVGMGSVYGNAGNEYIDLHTSDTRESYNMESGEGVSRAFCFAAMEADGDSKKFAQDFYDNAVSDISFQLVSCTDMDRPDDTPNLRLTTADHQVGSNKTKFVHLSADPQCWFDAVIVMKFTYDGREYSIQKRIWYEPDTVLIQIDPVKDDLAAILSTNQSFFDWLYANHRGEYNFMANTPAMNTWVNLLLPAKSYGAITSNLYYDGSANCTPNGKPFSVILNGYVGDEGDSGRTTMESLTTNNQITSVFSIHFVKSGSTTTAIAPNGTGGRIPGTIASCTFTGYNCAISQTGMGNVMEIFDCRFDSCGTGVLIDSKDTATNSSEAAHAHNVFFKCGTAVKIQKLPGSVHPFNIRFNRNLFLFNTTDFDVAQDGTFFFQRNFYSHKNLSAEDQQKTLDQWLNVSGNADIITRTNVKRITGQNTKLITNPFLKRIQDWDAEVPTLWVHTGNGETKILSSEASVLPVDAAAFQDGNGTDPMEIAILNSDGTQEIAQWTFNAPAEGGNVQ